jgi:hypothetical protein
MPPSPDTLPDYHFLLIAPNLGAEWLFDAARAYWERFRPIVASDLELARLLAPMFRVIVTVVARRDTAAAWGQTLADVAPNALFDAVIFDSFDDAKAYLNNRAAQTQPFGIPLRPTDTPPPPITPTPGSIIAEPAGPPTRAPAGFITLTPTPGAPENAPITPTPGAVTGG